MAHLLLMKLQLPQRGTEAYVPLLQKIKVPLTDIQQMNWSEDKWDLVRERLIQCGIL
ncbi:MAG: hypothetical protein AAFW70_18025 [Cyanobacteria bacterium J06635_10]